MAVIVSTRALIAALSIIALLVFVLPPGLAVWVGQRRESRAEALVHRLAVALATETGRSSLRRAAADGVSVLTGPGDPMTEAKDAAWRSTPAAPLISYFQFAGDEITADPWARNLIVNLGAGSGSTWVVSAGPNGILETPFAPGEAGQASGDDLAARVR